MQSGVQGGSTSREPQYPRSCPVRAGPASIRLRRANVLVRQAHVLVGRAAHVTRRAALLAGHAAACTSVLLSALLLGVPPLSAQETGIRVRVSGPAGPIAGATVELIHGDAVVRSLVSDSSGVVRLVGTSPGTYQVRVEAHGHRPHLSDPFSLTDREVRAVEVALEPAPVELEGLTVRADHIQIQRENTDFATTVGERVIELLPVAYDARELVALTPGARPENVWGGANFQANSYRIDGLSANHPGLGGMLFEPSTNWIERVEVRGLGAGAEHGGFQGGQVNVVTKSGRNDFSAMLRTMGSNDLLSGSNLVLYETGSEVKTRIDLEGEVRGAVVPDRLLYYLAGTLIDRSARVLNHVDLDSRYLPVLEEHSEQKLFGKLTWSPTVTDRVEVSGAYLGIDALNHGMTGYEGAGARSDYSAPTWFGNLAWRRSLVAGAVLETQLNRFRTDGRVDPSNGPDQPGMKMFALTPPYATYHNAPLTLRSASSSTSAKISTTFPVRMGGEDHLLRFGGEYTLGSYFDRRTRNGGMTWMPVAWEGFGPDDPTTWAHPKEGFIPTEWGGDVRSDAEILNAAAFAQTSVSIGRLVLSPGVRWGMWRGWMNSRAGEKVKAVEDQAIDLRVGAMLELVSDGSLVIKGHWGRYHQDLLAQMFDRAGGTDVFTDQEIWYYHGGPITDPTAVFTEAERDALEAQGLFTRESVISLNETGPAMDFRQPYIDQWLVGLEKQFGRDVKFEAVYTRRANHDMIALVDRNRESNYTRFERVRVHMGGTVGGALPFDGGSVYMRELYVPNNAVLEELRYCAANPAACDPLPGLSLADTLSLSWNPDYVLTTAPDARRDFWQLQLHLQVARPKWGGAVSAVWTGLTGNLDNVTGYTDPAEFGPGPFVRVNEGVNAYGFLPNFSEKEGKVALWGELPGEFRGGAFLTFRSGDHYSPQFRISGQGSFYGYVANAESYRGSCSPIRQICEPPKGDPLPMRFFKPLEGQQVFIGPRGQPQLETFSNLDLRLERIFELNRFDLGLSFDMFNALGADAVTRVQNLLNHGQGFHYLFKDGSTAFRKVWAGKGFRSPLERAAPRRLRLGMTVYF
jgi:hypothetical protein